MRPLHRRSTEAGFTAFELTLAVSLAGILGLAAVNFLRIPFNLKQRQVMTETKAALEKAADAVVNDIREANVATLDWGTLQLPPTPHEDFKFDKLTYDWSTNVGSLPTKTSYAYQWSSSGGNGIYDQLIFIDKQTNFSKIVASGLEPPSAQNPFVQTDPAMNYILTVTLRATPPGGQTVRVVRRVSIKT